MIQRAKRNVREWAKSRIVIPRWVFTLLYSEFTLLGVVGSIAGIPTLDLTTFDGYTSIWSIAIASFSAAAAFASVRESLESLEKWTAGLLVSTLLAYTAGALVLVAAGPNPAGRAAFSVVLLIATTPVVIRVLFLLSRAGIPRDEQ